MPARRDKGQLLYGSPLLDGLCCEQAMAVAPVGLTVPRCRERRRAIGSGSAPWLEASAGEAVPLLAPHRGVSRRLSGSLVFRSIGLILVFGEDPLWLVWVTVPTIAGLRATFTRSSLSGDTAAIPKCCP